MSTFLVLTVIGHDRPGLVETLSQTLGAHGASWMESRMSRLAGQFAGILRVSVPASRAASLASELTGKCVEGLQVTVERGIDEKNQGERRLVALELLGADRPAIIREVSEALALLDINVIELETECMKAPMSGEPLFRASARLSLPEGLGIDDLRHALEALADELMVELELEDAESDAQEVSRVY